MFRLAYLLLDLTYSPSGSTAVALGLAMSGFSAAVAVAGEPDLAASSPRVPPDPETQCRQPFALTNGIHRGEMLHFFFLDLQLLGEVLVGHAGHKHAAISSLLLQDGLDITGQLDGVLQDSVSFFQDLVPDFFLETPTEDRVHHEELHSLEPLLHDGVGLDLGEAKAVSGKGGDVVWLVLVGVPERLGNPVVESLNILLALLFEVLEGDAECLG